VTSKRQVTIPRQVAEEFGIGPGDVIRWEPAGDFIRVIPPGRVTPRLSQEERLTLFDRATARRDARTMACPSEDSDRGWTREEVHDRAHAR
jgi:bifunctional DNA-binding transcriptional regulator/antitoxin component of YhaV-PrlF toxin-antitoxin module